MEKIIIAYNKNENLYTQIDDLHKYYRNRGIFTLYASHDDNNIHFNIVGKDESYSNTNS